MQVVSLVIDFEAETSDGCSGFKLEIPESEVSAGDVVDLRLWGMSVDALAGWALYQGTTPLGVGTCEQVTGEEFEQELDWSGEDTDSQQLDWPVAGLLSVVAVSELLILDDEGKFETWASRGEDVTALFKRQGYSCLAVTDGTPIYGTVLCTAKRTTPPPGLALDRARRLGRVRVVRFAPKRTFEISIQLINAGPCQRGDQLCGGDLPGDRLFHRDRSGRGSRVPGRAAGGYHGRGRVFDRAGRVDRGPRPPGGRRWLHGHGRGRPLKRFGGGVLMAETFKFSLTADRVYDIKVQRPKISDPTDGQEAGVTYLSTAEAITGPYLDNEDETRIDVRVTPAPDRADGAGGAGTGAPAPGRATGLV